MKTSRILVVPGLAAASLLALTGCIQLPTPGGNTGTTTAPTTDTGSGGGTDTGASELAGTTWNASVDGFADFVMILQDDGTVDFTTWNDESVNYDYDADVWSGDASNLTITITGLNQGEYDLTATGTADGGSMSLSGQGTDGNDYTISGTQQ